ncbi:MAG TPA: NADH-quinone oxidoreductase subunit NuoE [Desulfatiglandales bacterium]|nr:NADH-quinone oxidoreductase subunit NuoE [Desulfatiglandales bacterium]
MGKVHVTIDGTRVSGQQGMTILEAAQKVDIEIPTLCHQEGITPSGNCRICVVEVEGSPRLVGSCHTPIAEGMVIHTRSAKVMEARRATVELLLSGHTGPCVTDSEVKECGLHEIASDLEVGAPRFQVRKPRFYPVEDVSPYVRRDMSKCILCGKCIRACTEIAAQNVYSMAYRGFGSKVVVDCDVPLNKEVCKDCGICIEYCPTSALMWPEAGKRREGASKGKAKAKPAPVNGKRERLLVLLESRQREVGHISEEAIDDIAGTLGLSVGDVYGVATFYAFLSAKPQGRHVIRICKSMPCYMKNAPLIIESVERAIGIRPGETTPDGRFSFELTNCIGACDQAPAMLINDEVYGDLTPGMISQILESHK